MMRKPFFWDDLVYNANENNYHRLSGAFLMVRKSSFLDVEGFDDFTFLYAEESILSDRFRNKGFLKISGLISGIFLTCYSFFRFVIEFFRLPDEQLGYLIFNLTMGQMISAIFFIVGVYLIINKYEVKRKY